MDLQGLASAISCKQPLVQDLPRPNQEKENREPQASGNPCMDPSWGSIVVASGDVTLWESITPVSTWSTGGSQEAIPPYDLRPNHQVANPMFEHIHTQIVSGSGLQMSTQNKKVSGWKF